MDSVTHNAVRAEQARRNFHRFITYTEPRYMVGWWNQLLARELQLFVESLLRKESPNLMIFAPPRHGKSELVSRRLPAYAFGIAPDIQIIGASYASDLARLMNRDVQRIIDAPAYLDLFPHTMLNGKNVRTTQSYLRNSEKFEIVNHRGSYRGAGVGEGITGMGCNLLVIDDPVKDAKEAASPTVQKAIYEWYTSTALTRVENGGGQLLTMTRWNKNDLAGKILEAQPGKWRVLSFPAIATVADQYRQVGEPLFPERRNLESLRTLEAALGPYYWGAMFQQDPTDRGGNVFANPDRIQVVRAVPRMVQTVRYWDKAGTQDGGCYTAGVKIGKGVDGLFYVLHVERGQWAAPQREAVIKQTADMDGPSVAQWLEEEGGSGGKESAQSTIKRLAGHTVYAERPTGDKVLRAEPYSIQVEAGNVRMLAGDWNQPFIAEHRDFPHGKYKDQIDAAAAAFNKLNGGKMAGTI